MTYSEKSCGARYPVPAEEVVIALRAVLLNLGYRVFDAEIGGNLGHAKYYVNFFGERVWRTGQPCAGTVIVGELSGGAAGVVVTVESGARYVWERHLDQPARDRVVRNVLSELDALVLIPAPGARAGPAFGSTRPRAWATLAGAAILLGVCLWLASLPSVASPPLMKTRTPTRVRPTATVRVSATIRPTTTASVLGEWAYVTADSVGVHPEPQGESPTSFYLLRCARMEVLGVRGHWLEVRTEKGSGFVDGNYVTADPTECD